ncbi:hypothetical protein [uncultured Butyricimonas sp.]|uniref:hypothetical protein n=1 Tax=uncultured Butyricimonas sp. TaxID=1268785 RepID=UPI0025939E90|nr:hypothetical protein [uncultured Butyricimonas sp.]
MEPIKKNGLDREVKRHEMNVEKIQTIVNDMIETGFVFGTGELRDLGSSCVILHDRAIEMAQKDSSRIRINFKRDADYKETLDRLNETIENNARELKKALLYHTSTPLEIEAFEINGGVVGVSLDWVESKEREYTILPTGEREHAMQLVDNVKKAIDELNSFVVGNDNFGKGISTSQDGRRCLCWLDGDGNFHEDKEAYEFI